jgi:hypothetical protein
LSVPQKCTNPSTDQHQCWSKPRMQRNASVVVRLGVGSAFQQHQHQQQMAELDCLSFALRELSDSTGGAAHGEWVRCALWPVANGGRGGEGWGQNSGFQGPFEMDQNGNTNQFQRHLEYSQHAANRGVCTRAFVSHHWPLADWAESRQATPNGTININRRLLGSRPRAASGRRERGASGSRPWRPIIGVLLFWPCKPPDAAWHGAQTRRDDPLVQGPDCRPAYRIGV